jgi:hypothetical protein
VQWNIHSKEAVTFRTPCQDAALTAPQPSQLCDTCISSITRKHQTQQPVAGRHRGD